MSLMEVRTVKPTPLQSSARTAAQLPADPAPFGPDQRAPERTTQEGDVLRQQNQPKGQHPHSQQRKDAEDATQEEEHAHGNAHPAGRGLTQPFEGAVQPRWKDAFHAVEPMVEALFVSVQLTLRTVDMEA